MSVAGVATGPAQLAVQMQGAARVLAVGSDRSDRVARPTAVAEKVTTTSVRPPPQPLNPIHRPITTITTSTRAPHITPIIDIECYAPDYCYQMVGPGTRQRPARPRVFPFRRPVRQTDVLHVVFGGQRR